MVFSRISRIITSESPVSARLFGWGGGVTPAVGGVTCTFIVGIPAFAADLAAGRQQ
jgi:hypothetical protein